MSYITNITRRMSNLAIRSNFTVSTSASILTHNTITNNNIKSNTQLSSTIIRTLSTKNNNSNDSTDKAWNEWQESLINTTSNDPSIRSNLKKRGGKTLRKKQEASKQSSLSDQSRLLDGAGPGQFPPLRYSDDETANLLEEAYSNIPERTGKRGTRAFKRQKVRFIGIRKARSIKKQEKIEHHFDRMEKRSLKMTSIRKMKELAVDVRQEDQNYQKELLRKVLMMRGYDSFENGTKAVDEKV